MDHQKHSKILRTKIEEIIEQTNNNTKKLELIENKVELLIYNTARFQEILSQYKTQRRK